MGRERDLKLQSYNISDNRYRELKYFCRQYREKQSQLRSITELSSPRFDSTGGGNKTSDRTADTACRRAQLQRDIEMIEQSAIEADVEISAYIMDNVVDGIAYEYLDVPASIASFYRKRRKFFWILDKMKR
ncbi:hypothetical protein [Anaerotignum sp. MB30-C6]|uniref:hypothetical protein n=1 Tax=Anaerotignum sp. MB30-C6 TaxID=3070814 RepID=UPI0027DCD798|nr:hypothetical protein [Anaerotignum sp. MB30-C6]WMI81830.1 hypothetical protein RBQ60_03635 [Anaerotignum sp. MB30-C6]